jgi:hypothetical protein
MAPEESHYNNVTGMPQVGSDGNTNVSGQHAFRVWTTMAR